MSCGWLPSSEQLRLSILANRLGFVSSLFPLRLLIGSVLGLIVKFACLVSFRADVSIFVSLFANLARPGAHCTSSHEVGGG